ncbi:MAG: hypothetical protein AAB791_01190, partial [Patescibacteria group bacterium]
MNELVKVMMVCLVVMAFIGCPHNNGNYSVPYQPHTPSPEEQGPTNGDNPATKTGSIDINGKLFTQSPMKALDGYSLTADELNQVFTEIADLTTEITVNYSSNGIEPTEIVATINPDSSFSLSIPNLNPGDYALKIFAGLSTDDVYNIGWEKNATATVAAGQATSVEVELERTAQFICNGEANNFPNAVASETAARQAWLVAMTGEEFPGLATTVSDGRKTFGIVVPNNAIIVAFKTYDDDGATVTVPVDTTGTAIEEGWTIFDKLDGNNLVATYINNEDTGSINVTVDPINPVEGGDEADEFFFEIEGGSQAVTDISFRLYWTGDVGAYPAHTFRMGDDFVYIVNPHDQTHGYPRVENGYYSYFFRGYFLTPGI